MKLCCDLEKNYFRFLQNSHLSPLGRSLIQLHKLITRILTYRELVCCFSSTLQSRVYLGVSKHMTDSAFKMWLSLYYHTGPPSHINSKHSVVYFGLVVLYLQWWRLLAIQNSLSQLKQCEAIWSGTHLVTCVRVRKRFGLRFDIII